MAHRPPAQPGIFTDQEAVNLARPMGIALLLPSATILLVGIADILATENALVFAIGLLWVTYLAILYHFIASVPERIKSISWLLALLNGIILTGFKALLPSQWVIIPLTMMALIAGITIIIWNRKAAYLFLVASSGNALQWTGLTPSFHIESLWGYIGLLILISAVLETLQMLSNSTKQRIRRLESLTEFSRQVGLSIEANQVFTLLQAALQNALEADTYFVGLVEDDKIKIDLIYDEGIFYPPMTVSMKGTLSGWIIRHNEPLFIPDLREEVVLDDVDVILMGNERTNLCWMGVPMIAGHVCGMIVVADYQPNAFDRTDFELLENLGQQAALALDNAYHHTAVERQSQLDSLTGVYNHGHFLKLLEKEASNRHSTGESISLVMLDIDYFKQYNDTYGHLTGDKVLIELVNTIQNNIHDTDLVGRWGGEEFAVALLDTTGVQAMKVAERIQATMMKLKMEHPTKGEIPAPTVSQGIASIPGETDDIYTLVDIADQRLYVAKERGRNQIEPPLFHWDKIRS